MTTNERPPSHDPFSTISLIERDPTGQDSSSSRWWQRLVSPPAPLATASLTEREAYRRGRYIGNTLICMIAILFVVTILIGGLVNHGLLPNLALTFLFLCLGAFFNKRGQVLISGLIVVLMLDLSIMGTFLAFGQMSTFLLPLLDLLVIPELFAASLLPPRFVFLDMALHIVYCICAITFLFPKTADLTAILSNPANIADAVAKPIVIQVITAVVAYTWMRSVTRTVERADRATSIAILERGAAEEAQQDAEQKRKLEREIQEIIAVHTQVANGNFDARVTLMHGNALWPIAGSLNNLISRLRGLVRESQRSQRTDEALSRFFHARSIAQDGIIPWQSTGTSIDTLVQQHNTLAQRRNAFTSSLQQPPEHV